ncbi:transposase [Caldicellulosiruptor danielii]|uniref:Transposase n=1 Tax=Anaerocellum danielii TaxID=1387557 RepID=A0ABZ0U2G7_9FIRM|nr:transposase [Caldicellulosiruptor danielii]WPX09879.1 transposase [Caldicellulosiruptor danielii]
MSDVNKIAEILKTAANRAFRLHPLLAEANDLALSMTLENIRFMQEQLKKLDKEISQLLKAFSQTLTTIPGIGDVLAAAIYAEIGDIKRFKNEAALAKYSGLVWTQYQSGNFNAQDVSLAKCGNQYSQNTILLKLLTVCCSTQYATKLSTTRSSQRLTCHQHKCALVETSQTFNPSDLCNALALVKYMKKEVTFTILS